MTQEEQERVRRIKQYVLARLREELSRAPRGAQAQLAKRLGVSGAHLSNMLSPSPSRQPGEDFRRKVAAHWGMSYAQLEALALGEDHPPASATSASARSMVAAALSLNLSASLSAYEWMPELPEEYRRLVREQAAVHERLGLGDYSTDEWRRIVTGLEREALALVARHGHQTTPPPRSGRPRRRERGA